MMDTSFLDILKHGNIYSGIIGIVGSLIGGLFTLAGVSWTLKRQEKEKEWDKFPERVNNLLEISITASKMYLKFNEFTSVRPYDHDKRGELENEILETLNVTYKLAARVDNVTFGKVDELYNEVRNALFKVSQSTMEGTGTEVYTRVDEIREKLMECSKFAIDRRAKLAHQFSNNLKKE